MENSKKNFPNYLKCDNVDAHATLSHRCQDDVIYIEHKSDTQSHKYTHTHTHQQEEVRPCMGVCECSLFSKKRVIVGLKVL